MSPGYVRERWWGISGDTDGRNQEVRRSGCKEFGVVGIQK